VDSTCTLGTIYILLVRRHFLVFFELRLVDKTIHLTFFNLTSSRKYFYTGSFVPAILKYFPYADVMYYSLAHVDLVHADFCQSKKKCGRRGQGVF
jgi:hypothetical protein